MQEGIVVIPKSVHAERMAENFDVFGFELTPGEMESMRSLDLEKSLIFNHEDPKSVEWFMESIRPKAIMPNDGELEQTD